LWGGNIRRKAALRRKKLGQGENVFLGRKGVNYERRAYRSEETSGEACGWKECQVLKKKVKNLRERSSESAEPGAQTTKGARIEKVAAKRIERATGGDHKRSTSGKGASTDFRHSFPENLTYLLDWAWIVDSSTEEKETHKVSNGKEVNLFYVEETSWGRIGGDGADTKGGGAASISLGGEGEAHYFLRAATFLHYHWPSAEKTKNWQRIRKSLGDRKS